MTDPLLVQHSSPLGTLTIPTPSGQSFAVKAGVPTELPVEVDGRPVAGRAPGPWVRLPDGEAPDLDNGQAWRAVDGAWEHRDPGAGVLAQDDVWAVVAPAKKTNAASAADTTPEV